jgi:hypothetical protein
MPAFATDPNRSIDRNFSNITAAARALNGRGQLHFSGIGKIHFELNAIKLLPLCRAVVVNAEAVLELAARTVRFTQRHRTSGLEHLIRLRTANQQRHRR